MKLKENVQIDILKRYGFTLVEHNQESGFKRYTKHYGCIIMTICNHRLEKQIHLTLQENGKSTLEDKRIIASIHQINKDLCTFAINHLLDLGESETDMGFGEINDWEAQMAQCNPFAFLMDETI